MADRRLSPDELDRRETRIIEALEDFRRRKVERRVAERHAIEQAAARQAQCIQVEPDRAHEAAEEYGGA